jgi:hypothetical protein
MLSAKMAEAQAEASLEAALAAEELAIVRGKAATAEASVAMVGRGPFVTEPWTSMVNVGLANVFVMPNFGCV